MNYKCQSCGETHELPMAFHADVPAAVNTIPEAEQEARVDCDGELCIIDEEYFFVHGVIELPVTDGEGPFVWGVWCSLSEKSFDHMVERWETPGREHEPPYFGWLSTELPYGASTLNLKTRVHSREVGLRPWVELEPTDHPLAIEQRTGITMARVQQIVERLRHGDN